MGISKLSNKEEFLTEARKILDMELYGQEEAKNSCMQYFAQLISNPKEAGNVVDIQGSMGNGKTTLVREGICKALFKAFAMIQLGGASHSEYLNGHSYTYEGSKPGKIVEAIKKCKTNNMVYFFDELDKVSGSEYGGVREKNLGAMQAGITCVLLPFANKTHVDKFN